MKITVEQLAKRLGAELTGNTNKIGGQITAVSPVKTAGESEVTFVSDDKHKASLSQSDAGAVIVSTRIEGIDKPQLIVKNVDAALIEALRIFAPALNATP
jgi:UDP-3-O-[3-hydroxymyristoyl] glucosamine N-acyltransferase